MDSTNRGPCSAVVLIIEKYPRISEPSQFKHVLSRGNWLHSKVADEESVDSKPTIKLLNFCFGLCDFPTLGTIGFILLLLP